MSRSLLSARRAGAWSVVLASLSASSVGCSDAPGIQDNLLTVTRESGKTFTLAPSSVFCAPSGEDPSTEYLHVREETNGLRLAIQIRPSEGERTIELPSVPEGQSKPEIFIGNSKFKVSSSQEDSTGTLTILTATCEPTTRLTMKVDASLGSEFVDGEPVKVTGMVVYEVPTGRRP